MKKNYAVSHYGREKYLTAFFLGFLIMLAAVVPVMIAEGGHFIYYGDFNAQQIPFYNLLNDAIRNGQLGWNWYTDLGSDLMTSYSFYLIGSPFFWLTVLIPRWLVNYSIPVILAIKHGVAALTSYIYIRRFVKNKNSALAGALLYAFSGFQVYNIFFNHFQDVTAFFPLLLIAMEENVNRGRKGWFALTVALMAVTNYYFFAGQCIFLVLYYFARANSKDFKIDLGKFVGLIIEAVLGVMIAGFILVPSAMLLMGNYRIKERVFGLNALIFNDGTTPFRVIQSFFMPVDVPARPNLFSSDSGKWASIAGYLPLYSMTGVITFFRTRKKHWAVKLSAFCIFCSLIPILNSIFQLLNGYYYARWFYMPILIFAMMTAQVIDDAEADFMPSIKITGIILAVFGLMACMPTYKDGKTGYFNLPNDVFYFFLTWGIAVAFLIAAAILYRFRRTNSSSGVLTVVSTSIASLVCVLTAVLYVADSIEDANKYVDMAIEGKSAVYEEVSEDNFFRIDISDDCDNYSMIWGLPNMRAFQSVVNTSIMDFYDKLDIQRDVASRADVSHYTLRGLFSVKYYYREKIEDRWYTSGDGKEDYSVPSRAKNEAVVPNYVNISGELPGFEYVGENEYFEIYENKLYVPMGIAFDSYITEKEADNLRTNLRERLLMKSLVLTRDQAKKYSDYVEPVDEKYRTSISMDNYTEFCEEKQANCADSFTYDSDGFTSHITLEKPQLVFFSVPYSEGWTAEVNGKPVKAEKVSYGFMAVPCEEGENNIVFRYQTPGIETGCYISLGGAILLLIYMIVNMRSKKKRSEYSISHVYEYESYQKVSASQIYCEKIKNPKKKKKGSK